MSGHYQRGAYKIIDQLLSHSHSGKLEMLQALVRDIVENEQLVVTGGRVWELDAAEDVYVLRYQEGELEFLSEGTKRTLQEIPAMLHLASSRTIVVDGHSDAGDARAYSLVGVGDVVARATGGLYPYALAFTAKAQTAEFNDTLMVIGSAATTAMRNMQTKKRELRHKRDLDKAWEIQRGLVPDHATTYNDFDIYGISVPDAVVGGDYFDYLRPPLEEELRLGLVISDAASKGLPAAVQALFVSGAMRMGTGFNTKMSTLIARLNALIFEAFPYERFVSLFYCELTPSSNGLVLYVNGGHCPPIHYQESSNNMKMLLPTGGILGIVADQPFRTENINMGHGDILLMYTDGISEAHDDQGRLYGEDRLRSILHQNREQSSEMIARAILEDVQRYSAGASYADDQTLVVVKRRPRP